jgi:hypothetical protein
VGRRGSRYRRLDRGMTEEGWRQEAPHRVVTCQCGSSLSGIVRRLKPGSDAT